MTPMCYWGVEFSEKFGTIERLPIEVLADHNTYQNTSHAERNTS